MDLLVMTEKIFGPSQQKMDYHVTQRGLIFEDRHGMLWFANGVVLSTFERGKPIDMSYNGNAFE